MSEGMKNYGKLNIPDFIWWLGIVEDNNDPSYAGRVKVRITGYHSGNLSELPTKDLPYAIPLNSVTSAGVNGIMENHSLVQGSTVIGFFADGSDGQIPMILGTIAGKPAARPKDFETVGFQDPTGTFPKEPDSPDEGFAGVGEPDISRLARNQEAETHWSLLNRREQRETEVPTARAPSVSEDTGDAIIDDVSGVDYEGETWDEPHPRGKSKDEAEYFDVAKQMQGGDGPEPPDKEWTSLYPFNTVKETRAGHVFETDNTESNRRIHEWHASGTHYEIHDDGTKVTNVIGDNYELTVKNNNVLIRGSCNVTIEGDSKLLVMGDKYEEVRGNYFLSVEKDRVTKINGNDIKSIISDVTQSIKGNRTTRVALDDTETIVGNQTINIAKNRTDNVGETINKTYGKDNKQIKKDITIASPGTLNIRAGTNLYLGAQDDIIIGSGKNTHLKAEGTSTYESVGNQLLKTEGTQTQTVEGQQTIEAENTDIKNDVDITGTSTASTDHVSNGISGHDHTHTGSPTAGSGAVSDTGAPK